MIGFGGEGKRNHNEAKQKVSLIRFQNAFSIASSTASSIASSIDFTLMSSKASSVAF